MVICERLGTTRRHARRIVRVSAVLGMLLLGPWAMNPALSSDADDERPSNHVNGPAEKPRLPYVDAETADPAQREFFDRLRTNGREPLNLHRIWAHSPELLASGGRFAVSLRTGTVAARTHVELAIIRATQLSGGDYEEIQHRTMAAACGLTPNQISAIADWRSSDLFDSEQRAILGWTEGLFRDAGPTDVEFSLMESAFSPREIVEITAAASTYAGFSMFTKALRVPLEADAGKAMGSNPTC